MEQKIIFRVEDQDGNGPYRNRPMNLDVRCDDHPTPLDEGISMHPEYVCGFESIKKLLAWFNADDRKYLHDQGFSVVVYQADDFLLGEKQVVFKRTKNN